MNEISDIILAISVVITTFYLGYLVTVPYGG